MLVAYTALIDIFVNHHNVEALCTFFTRFLIGLSSTSQTAERESQQSLGRKK